MYCQNRYKTHKNAKFTNGKPFIFTFQDREDSYCCTFPHKLFRERPFLKHSYRVVYDVNSLERHKNKHGPSAENRLSPGTELLFPFYFETNYVAEPEQKKNKLQKGGGGSTKNIETRVLFFILQNIKRVFISPSWCMDYSVPVPGIEAMSYCSQFVSSVAQESKFGACSYGVSGTCTGSYMVWLLRIQINNYSIC